MRFDDIGPTMERVEGAPMNAAEVGAIMGHQGFVARQRQHNAAHQRRVTEAARLLVDCMTGRCDARLFSEAMNPTNYYAILELQERYPALCTDGGGRNLIGLRETMSYSDYSALTVDVLDRTLYGYYTAAPVTNEPLVKKHPLRDFRIRAIYEMDGGVAPFTRMPYDSPSPTPSGAGEPPSFTAMQQAAREVQGSTQRVTYQPQLYQGGMAVNWRAIVNDDLGIFNDMIQRLAISGRRTIYKFITQLYCSAGGPNTTLFNSTFRNLVTTAYGASTNNPALSFQGLIDATTVIEKQQDLGGDPITFEGQLYLVYGPALARTAEALLAAVQADISVGGGTTNAQGFPSQRLRVATDYVVRNMKPIQDKYLPIVCTTSGIRDTQWYLFYEPAAQARPALELGQLSGYETPQLYQKVPNTMRVGGGVDPMLGDFYSMNQEYKGLLVMGGTQVDGRSCVASTGQGS
jgi:hypothetical protein